MKIKNIKTNNVFFFETYNEALRKLYGTNGLPLLQGKSYKTVKQALDLFKRNDYQLCDADEEVTATVPVVKKEVESASGKDIMTQFAEGIAKMIQVEETINEVVESKIELMEDRLTSKITDIVNDVNEAIHNAKPQVKQIEVKRWDGQVKSMGIQHQCFEDLLITVSTRTNVVLVGPAGSGKTSGAEKVAEALDLKFYSMSVGSQTTETKFQGFQSVMNGDYVWSLFRKAFEFGGIFLLDEFDAGSSHVLVSINQALANGYAAFPDGMIKKHEDFICIAAANTYGTGANREYVGRQQLDAATLDRFCFMEWGYDDNLEESLTDNKEWLAYVRRVRAIVMEKKIRTVVSPRATIFGTKLLAAGMRLEKVKEMCIYKGLNPSERAMIANA